MTQIANEWRFLRGFLASPLTVASPLASGHRLAEVIAAQIEPNAEPVLELGAGTGAVTSAILARGVSPNQLIAIERDTSFVQHLRQRFPLSLILEGDAFDFARVLREADSARPLGAIVCGIPVLNQP